MSAATIPQRTGGTNRRLVLETTLQLALLLLVVWRFHIESRTFFLVLVLAAGGFLLTQVVRPQYRLGLFAVLSAGSVPLAFGLGGLWLLGLGSGLILLCHLPVRFRWRVALVLAAGGALALARVGLIPLAVPASVWPILGAMFMFRIALYLHGLRHHEVPSSPSLALAYFFMLPNVCFPLFPVVDYKTFATGHNAAPLAETAPLGLRWMVRGVIHLLCYRYIYYHLTLDLADVHSLGGVIQYVLATYGLYLRVSGQFHLIVGMLVLLGFRLPETHHLYYLANSFTDFWRRINIYWKDFMMKLVYYPSFFAFRRRGQVLALVLATVAVFVATWALHAYQWFWLRGTFPLDAPDMLFWGSLGAIVVVNAVIEFRRGRQRVALRRGWSAGRALRTLAIFTAISILWSLWSAPSVSAWVDLMRQARHVRPGDLAVLAGLVTFMLALAGFPWGVSGLAAPRRRHPAVLLPQLATLALLLLLSMPAAVTPLGLTLASRIESLKQSGLNRRDARLQERGYYENLTNVTRFNTQLWEVHSQMPRPADWAPRREPELYVDRNDLLLRDLRPNLHMLYLGQPFTTNRWGMRDQAYTKAKPPGTYRIAVLGPSVVMGYGVGDGQPFEAVLEDRLNRELGGPGIRFECLNFGISATSLLQEALTVRARVRDFAPDLVIATSFPGDADFLAAHLAQAVRHRIPITDSIIARRVAEAGVRPDEHHLEVERKLLPAARELVPHVVGLLADEIAATGARGLLLRLRLPTSPGDPSHPALAAARAAGMDTADFSHIFPSDDEGSYRLGEEDTHPNARGHRQIANALMNYLTTHAAEFGLPSAGAPVYARP